MMIDFDNRTDFNLDVTLLEEIALTLTKNEIELILTKNDDIQLINREYRNIDKPTDVLSFPSDPFPGAPIGSIIINIDAVHEVAKNLNHSSEHEIALLFIHGLLHLLGYDHETDDGEMRHEEIRLIETFKLPKSLIVRTEDI